MAVLVGFLSACAHSPSAPVVNSVPGEVQGVVEYPAESDRKSHDRQTQSESNTSVQDAYERPTAPPVEQPSVAPSVAPKGAVKSLYDRARHAQSESRWSDAIALAERGLRINRKQSELYLILSESYLAQGNEDQARAFAEQGMRYTEKRSAVGTRLQSIISKNE
ncbi:hypothetical protein GCM10007877_35900 [Marinibactrum halimedae]|uniref:Tetratricopeptide repeat protein n=2 Tax=Marinibactrum halimedae TaxID=1444977 RepID=A0AA37T910_9GAMM|nr:hypothetical protein GCM10007877_35900 [Marinibactrum halimedae]